MPWTKFIILGLILAILISLFSGLFFLIKDNEKSKRSVHALTFRITLSVILILLLIFGWYLGLIQFHQISSNLPN